MATTFRSIDYIKTQDDLDAYTAEFIDEIEKLKTALLDMISIVNGGVEDPTQEALDRIGMAKALASGKMQHD